MIRPSALQVAEKCALSHVLAEQFPEASEYTEAGNLVHETVANSLELGHMPNDRACADAVRAIRAEYNVLGIETPLSLIDHETAEVISAGTTDVVARHREDGILTIIDHKTGRPERVTPARDSLQLHAYGLAAAFAAGENRYAVVISHIVDGKFWFGERYIVDGDEEMWAIFTRIKKAVGRSKQEKKEAYRGSHCDSCFQQSHCPAYILPAYEGAGALEPITKPGGLTKDNAVRALRALEAIQTAGKVVDARLRAFVRDSGPIVDGDRQWGPSVVSGRRSGPGVSELERLGMTHLIKQGEPQERFGWRKV